MGFQCLSLGYPRFSLCPSVSVCLSLCLSVSVCLSFRLPAFLCLSICLSLSVSVSLSPPPPPSLSLSLSHRLDGLVVMRLPLVESYGWLFCRPGAWRYRVRARTGWLGVSIMWFGEIARLICFVYLREASHEMLSADPSLRHTSMLMGR